MIHVLGFGSVGRLVAHTLKRQGLPVTLLVRSDSLGKFSKDWKLDVVSTIHGHTTTTSSRGYHFEGSTDNGSTTKIKRLVICTKAFDAAPAVKAILARLCSDTQITLLGNGIGADHEIKRIMTSFNMTPNLTLGILSHGTYSIDNSTLCHAGIGPFVLSTETNCDEARRLVRHLALLNCEFVEYGAFLQLQLNKLLVNAVINPITAIIEQKNGYVSHYPEMIDAILNESIPIMRSSFPTCKFDVIEAREGVNRVVQSTAMNRSSMLQDIQHDKFTEIDYINGAISRLGKDHSMETSLNDCLVGLVKRKSGHCSNNVIDDFQTVYRKLKKW